MRAGIDLQRIERAYRSLRMAREYLSSKGGMQWKRQAGLRSSGLVRFVRAESF
jgi:hypothetical protein